MYELIDVKPVTYFFLFSSLSKILIPSLQWKAFDPPSQSNKKLRWRHHKLALIWHHHLRWTSFECYHIDHDDKFTIVIMLASTASLPNWTEFLGLLVVNVKLNVKWDGLAPKASYNMSPHPPRYDLFTSQLTTQDPSTNKKNPLSLSIRSTHGPVT